MKKMLFCTHCGKQLEDDALFCSKCGTPTDNNSNSQNNQEEKVHDEVYKCPNCGGALKAFQITCPYCDYELNNPKASNAIKEFSLRLQQIEAERKPASMSEFIANAYGIRGRDTTDDKIIMLIRTFYVPNTKEDVLEFLILASSNINYRLLSGGHTSGSIGEGFTDRARSEAWIAKVEQVYQKARFSFGADSDFKKIQALYEEAIKSVKDAKKRKKRNQKWLFVSLCGYIKRYNPCKY